MTYEMITALAVFAFVSSITPGPNNLMLMSSGANFGFKLTIPHMLGVGIGFTLMIVLVGLGVIQLFDQFPVSYDILKTCSIAYLLYLAFKIATSTSIDSNTKDRSKPFSFIQAALFQWVNPKAWTMALTSISVYAPSKSLTAVLMVALVFGLINLPCVSTWVGLGQKMRQFLTTNNRLKLFNFAMAGLLVASIIPAL